MQKVLFVFGTRPEAIKLCPVARFLRAQPDGLEVRICVTGQHRSMLDQVLEAFEIHPDHDLEAMREAQTLHRSSARILAALEPVLECERPAMIVVQGDTTTTFAGALAGFYSRIPVAHVEAGLRTGNVAEPFPEEMNRLLTSRLATLHFAATEGARQNLIGEGVPAGMIAVTGNPVIDAVLHVRDRLESRVLEGFDSCGLDESRKLILVTAHRRESFGEGIENICRALLELAARDDVEIVFPVHPNPGVRAPVHRLLAGHPRIRLLEPLSYVPFVDLMRRSWLVLTDSGGIQEEGPSLGKPILVMRERTERPEAVEAGTVRLVGTDPGRIVQAAGTLLDDPFEYAAMARVHNPYGDGSASSRISHLIHSFLRTNFLPKGARPVASMSP